MINFCRDRHCQLRRSMVLRYHGHHLRAMDFSIRCNSLKCRAQLAEQAVVTTCRYVLLSPILQTLTWMQSHLLLELCRYAWPVKHESSSTYLSSMQHSPPQPRRCSIDESVTIRRLQNERSQWSDSSYHHRMRFASDGVLVVSDYSRDVSWT